MEEDSGQITKKSTTKPSVISDDIVREVGRSMHQGWSVEMACKAQGVSRSAFYSHLQKNPLAKELIDFMKRAPTEQALVNVVRAINDGDLKVSMWYLERVNPEIYNPKVIYELEYLRLRKHTPAS